MTTFGLVVNPVAGVGGAAGLKGSDGRGVQSFARRRGGHERASERAQIALSVIASTYPGATVLTAAGVMGEEAVRGAGLEPVVVYRPGRETSGEDSTAAANAIVAQGVGLLLFAGGDGTARDVSAAMLDESLVLGIPAGVKMYSSCFAVSPAAAGAAVVQWLKGSTSTLEAEVLDVDETQVRSGRVDPRLYALVSIPHGGGRTQARKSAAPDTERMAVRNAAVGVVERMDPQGNYLLGPGGTMAKVAELLGVACTPLGVDVVRDGRVVLEDASERELIELLQSDRETSGHAIVSVIGGQGFLLGRGNQQLSAEVVKLLGSPPLIAVATEQKLIELRGRPLLVDTGDLNVDARLSGFVEVVTGPRASSFYPVKAPELEGKL
ncbi:MAG: NAD(+)/NADH kinase [Terrimesophilobacter sp.]